MGDLLVIGDLMAHLGIVDSDGNEVGHIGVNKEISSQEGWPNALDGGGRPMRTPRLREDRLNSPQGLAADAEGNSYVAEWMIRGRMIKPERV